jgi:tRNA 5-methylaminomethyl-2-thiouridine biosynthesis bifunctional protein
MVTVPTASLQRSPEGTPWSALFGDVYHSAGGGLAQARRVFLGGNDLPRRWAGRDAFTILETGFGLGVNFLAAWDAWRGDPRRSRRLHFVSVEARPFAAGDLREALAPLTEVAPLADALVAAWPPPLAGFHRLHFESGNVILTLLLGEAMQSLPQLVATADALFLDGFAPARNPGMWSPEVVRELARLAAPGATLATWTVAGGVRTALADAGFRIEKRAGFGAKREMLCGTRDGTPPSPAGSRSAVVIGAGVAGCVVAERLASRQWQVQLVDPRGSPEAAAVGLLRPIANLRDAVNAQVSRSAFGYALRHFDALQPEAEPLQWKRCGVLQLAADDDEAVRFEAIAGSHGYPAALLEWVDAGRAAQIARRALRGGGWWFRSGAIVSPASLAGASLARAAPRVTRLSGRIERLEREGGSWRALDGAGRVVAEAATLVLANAADARRLLPGARLRLSSVRGQVTYLRPSGHRPLDVVVSGSGYVAPLPDGGHCIGASYRHDDADPGLRESDHLDNLARAESMLPGFTSGIEADGVGGWAGFRATVPDRLPIFGASAEPGIHLATGLGSRGLLWAPLGAELLASALEGEPLPLSRDHAGAISPRRFLS